MRLRFAQVSAIAFYAAVFAILCGLRSNAQAEDDILVYTLKYRHISNPRTVPTVILDALTSEEEKIPMPSPRLTGW